MSSLAFPLLFIFAIVSQVVGELTLAQVVVVSRHGIRTPYAPENGTVSDFSSYTNKVFPDADAWGMSEEAFSEQYLTPWGEINMQKIGEFYRARYENSSLSFSSCEDIQCYSDYGGNATRDVNTAINWYKGFGCPDINVNPVSETNFPDLQPVLSDHYDVGCPLATEDQVNGMYGGDPNAITSMYYDAIAKVDEVLDMPANASICKVENENFNEENDCSLFETGYFAEAWMFQYLSNLDVYGFGMLTIEQLRDLYNMHIESMWFGTNIWNSQAYSSQQLAYVVASLQQMVTGKAVKGVDQAVTTRLLTLFSHDTNILYLRRLLGLNWVPLGYDNNVATPGGALSFELWQDSDSLEYFVKAQYIAASPEQQRAASNLTETLPSIATVVLPDCGEVYCPWETFAQIALKSINMDCVQEPLQTSSQSLYSSMDPTPGGDNDDNKVLSFGGWGLVGMTALVCTLLFAALYMGHYYCAKKDHSAYQSTLQDEDDKRQSLLV